MSINVKYTQYTVISRAKTSDKKIPVSFEVSEIPIMIDYVTAEIRQTGNPVTVLRETMTLNYHKNNDCLKKQSDIRSRKMQVWDKVPGGPLYNGFFDWLNYHPCGNFAKGR